MTHKRLIYRLNQNLLRIASWEVLINQSSGEIFNFCRLLPILRSRDISVQV